MGKKCKTIMILVLASILLWSFGVVQGVEAAKTKNLKLIAWAPPTASEMQKWIVEWVDRVNKQSGGELNIVYLGGNEVIPTADQPEAIRRGTVDMGNIAAVRLAPYFGESTVFQLNELYYWEQRETGLYDWIRELAASKMNCYFVGLCPPIATYLFSKKKINSPSDLEGLRVAETAWTMPFSKAVGLKTVSVVAAEWYTAVQQGLADAVYWDPTTALKQGYYEIVKYVVPYSAVSEVSNSTCILINGDVWKSLSKNAQDTINRVHREMEYEWTFWSLRSTEGALRELTTKHGMVVCRFPADVAKAYMQKGMDGNWEAYKGKMSPESYSKMRNIMSKDWYLQNYKHAIYVP